MEALHYVLIGGVAALLLGKKKEEPATPAPPAPNGTALTVAALKAPAVQADTKGPVQLPSPAVLPKYTYNEAKALNQCIQVKSVSNATGKALTTYDGWRLNGSFLLRYGSLCPPGATYEEIVASYNPPPPPPPKKKSGVTE